MAVTLYLQDYEVYPTLNMRPNRSDIRWYDLLQPYVANRQVFLCPSANPADPANLRNGSYGYNYQYLGNAHFADAARRLRSDADISAPADTVAIVDTDGIRQAEVEAEGRAYVPMYHSFTVDPPLSNWTSPPQPAQVDEDNGWSWLGHRSWPTARHNDGGNVAFCDGHGKWLKREQLLGSLNDNSLWNGRNQPGI